MIKLTLTPLTQPISYLFDKNRIIIGRASIDEIEADLHLPVTALQAKHIVIEKVEDGFIVINLEKDPFTTVNGLPFYKQILANGDLIEIHSVLVQFDSTDSENTPVQEGTKLISLNKIIELPVHLIENCSNSPNATENDYLQLINELPSKSDLIENCSNSPNPNAAESDYLQLINELPSKSHLNQSIDDLLRRVEELEAALNSLDAAKKTPERHLETKLTGAVKENTTSSIATPYTTLTKKPLKSSNEQYLELDPPLLPPNNDDQELDHLHENMPKVEKLQRRSLKDDYLRDLDDENEGELSLKNRDQLNPRLVISWKTLFTFVAGLMLFCSAAFAIFYFSVAERSEKEEIKVAAAVADVVMALNFAQINHALPQNQNWSDPDFLKHNLSAVLSKGYFPLANIDSHGQFHGTSYILRIYTSNDLAHFLVIAQPNASLLQWLVPKSAIVVDSQLMELRKSNDLKTINRLLVDPTLDSSNSAEIAHLVGQGQLITFDKINKVQKEKGFSSPKALAFIRPGAENLIYNALRYFHFGESVSRKAVALYENPESQNDTSHLTQEIEALMKLKNVVLYTSGGLQTAIATQKALAIFAPQHKFLFGYVQINPKGVANNGHLLIDDSASPIADADSSEIQENSHYTRNKNYANSAADIHEAEEAILNNLLPELYRERQGALKIIEDNINLLLDAESYTAIPNFSKKLHQLRQEYDFTENEYQINIIRALGLLSIATLNDVTVEDDISSTQDTPSVIYTPAHLTAFVKTKSMPYVSWSNLLNTSNSPHINYSREQFVADLDRIQQAESLEDLKIAVLDIGVLLTFPNILNQDRVEDYENEVYMEVITKLDLFFQYPYLLHYFDEFGEKNRLTLFQILDSSWVDKEELENYMFKYNSYVHSLNEF